MDLASLLNHPPSQQQIPTPRSPLGNITHGAVTNTTGLSPPPATTKQGAKQRTAKQRTAPVKKNPFMNAAAIEHILRATVTHCPFTAKHGAKKNAWLAVQAEVQSFGYC